MVIYRYQPQWILYSHYWQFCTERFLWQVIMATTWTIVLMNVPMQVGWFAFHPPLQSLAILLFTFGMSGVHIFVLGRDWFCQQPRDHHSPAYQSAKNKSSRPSATPIGNLCCRFSSNYTGYNGRILQQMASRRQPFHNLAWCKWTHIFYHIFYLSSNIYCRLVLWNNHDGVVVVPNIFRSRKRLVRWRTFRRRYESQIIMEVPQVCAGPNYLSTLSLKVLTLFKAFGLRLVSSVAVHSPPWWGMVLMGRKV